METQPAECARPKKRRIASECSKLAELKYKGRHEKVAGAVHWSLCNKYSVQCSQQWYQHTAESVTDKENVKILWHVNIQTDHVLEHPTTRRSSCRQREQQGTYCSARDRRVDEKEQQ